MINEIKSFWDKRPCNIKHSSKAIGSIEYFNEVEQKKYYVEPHILKFAEFPAWYNKKVLEIGCGIGTDSINFVRHGAKLTAIDLSSESIKICKSRFDVFKLKANIICGNAENLDNHIQQNEQFDLIYSFGAIHHTPNPIKIINHIYDFLKYGGECRIMLYSKYSFKLFDIINQHRIHDFSLLDNVIQKYSEAQTGCPKTYTYTTENIKALFNKFKILSINKDHIFKYDILNYINGKYIIRDCFKNMTTKQFQEMCSEIGWHMLIKCKKVKN